MSRNFTDFEFSPGMRWSYREDSLPINRDGITLDAEKVRELAMWFLGLQEETLGDALVGAKPILGTLWSICHVDSGGWQLGTMHIEIREDGQLLIVLRMQDLETPA